MHRRSLNDLPAEEQAQLARVIQDYVTPEIVRRHWDAVSAGVHNSPTSFLSFHRNLIEDLEDFLNDRGYRQWVPLPAWDPANPVPEAFNIPNSGPGRLSNLNPGISFARFSPERLADYKTDAELGRALMGPHNQVHREVGGTMNNMRTSPEAPIFWPWHAFIDDIWWEWQRQTVIVPLLAGMSLERARSFAGGIGLKLGWVTGQPPRRREPVSGSIVRTQAPEQGLRVTRGTKINLGIEYPSRLP